MASKGKGGLEPGTVLFDYPVLEFVGEGGWAYVYKAQHPKLPMFVAIKQLKPEWVEDQDALKRFLLEADIVAQVNHPNVVNIYDRMYDEETGSHYIITEFAEKGTLADRLGKLPEGLPIDEVLHLAMGICNGLEAVHRSGVIHRDIKPGNILLFGVGGSQDMPKLSDFGIARAPAFAGMAIPSTSGVIGTFYYMSPEQLDRGVEVDHRSDLYSLGILLYQILTGQVPFTGELYEVFWAHMFVSPTPPRELRLDIPEALEQIVLRALRKDCKDRYQSAADMHDALRAIVDISIRRERQCEFEVLLGQGLAHLAQEEWEKAIESLRQSDVLESGNEQVRAGLQKAREQQNLKRLYELGVQHLEEEKWEEAREHLAELMGYDPDYAGGQAREQLEWAAQELERERSRRDLMVQYRTGMGRFRKHQWPLVIAELEQVVAQDPEFEDAADRLAKARRYAHADLLFEQAQSHTERGKWEEAVDLFEEVERLNPPHIDVTRNLRSVRVKWAEAREGHRLLAWYDEGVFCLKAGDLGQARMNFEEIYERRPDYRDVANRLKEIDREFNLKQLSRRVSEHEAAGEWQQVIGVCREILAVDPSDREASRCLKRAQKRAERGDGKWPRGIAATVWDWWDDRDRRVKVALVGLFGFIVLALCVAVAQVARLSFPLWLTATPTVSPATLTITSPVPPASITPTTVPTPISSPTSTPTPTLTPTETLSPTPTYTPTPTPTATSTVVVPIRTPTPASPTAPPATAPPATKPPPPPTPPISPTSTPPISPTSTPPSPPTSTPP